MAATYPLLWLVLKRNPLLWVLTHILSTATLPSLIVLWGAMVAAALATVQAQTSKANTRCRTIAHFFYIVFKIVKITSLSPELFCAGSTLRFLWHKHHNGLFTDSNLAPKKCALAQIDSPTFEKWIKNFKTL